MAPPIGAVLCGGASRRMGVDKAAVEVDGTPMARRVGDVLAAAGCSPVIAIGGDPTALGHLGLDVVDDGFPGQGPLGGILTALSRWRTDRRHGLRLARPSTGDRGGIDRRPRRSRCGDGFQRPCPSRSARCGRSRRRRCCGRSSSQANERCTGHSSASTSPGCRSCPPNSAMSTRRATSERSNLGEHDDFRGERR